MGTEAHSRVKIGSAQRARRLKGKQNRELRAAVEETREGSRGVRGWKSVLLSKPKIQIKAAGSLILSS